MARLPEITQLELGTFRFPDPELSDRTGVIMGYAIRHRGGVFLFDTGFGYGNPELDETYQPTKKRIADALAEAGVRIDDVTAVANCHLHADHSGQNAAFPDIPIYVQAAEWELAHTTDHTILEWIDFPSARYVPLVGDYEPFDGIRIVATPGHTRGHQSLAVDTADGLVVLAGQAVYTVDEWAGTPDELEGRSSAPDPAAYDGSLDRLRALEPERVFLGHDRRSWTRLGA